MTSSPSLEVQIFHHLFDLTIGEANVLDVLLRKQQWMCINHIVEEMGVDRSVIQKYLKVLEKRQLIVRQAVSFAEFKALCMQTQHPEQAPKSDRGYRYLYQAKSPTALLSESTRRLDSWGKILQQYLQSDNPPEN